MHTRSPNTILTAERIARLCKLVRHLGSGPHSRSALLKKLRIDTRSLYRDLEMIERLGVEIERQDGGYSLSKSVAKSLERLPFPDPRLNVQEVLQLAKGRTAAHRKLRARVREVLG